MAFTEQGVAMLSSVLRSPRALKVNIAIMRTFVRLREMLLSHADLARKLAALENKYDAQYNVRGRRWMDCIGRLVRRPRVSGERESIQGGLRCHSRIDAAAYSPKARNRVSCSRKSNARIWRAEEELTHGRLCRPWHAGASA
jgi:hypothetical protein